MSIPILDTHQHLIYADTWPYSWTHDIPALAGKSFRYPEYLEAIEGTGIAATVFMESTPDDPHWVEETAFVDGLSQEPDSLIQGIIANCRPEHEDFGAYLDSLPGHKVRGLRRFLHVAPVGTAEQPCFIPNLQLLADRGLTFDLCVFEKQLPMTEGIVRACPDVSFVLDHCGVPEIDGGDFASWAAAIKSISRCENLTCKLSGVLAYCPPEKVNTETVRPYVEHVIACFGWDRVVWGSDWPVVTLTSSLKAWVATTREIIGGEDPDNQAKLLHRNAERIYNLKPIAAS